MNMNFKRKLPIPMEIKELYPLSLSLEQKKTARDVAIRQVFEGKSDKFILVIGPCSADSEDSVLDYVTRLAAVQEKVADKLILIPRVYTNKPRTIVDGRRGCPRRTRCSTRRTTATSPTCWPTPPWERGAWKISSTG